MKVVKIVILCCLVFYVSFYVAGQQPVSYVNPFIGTSNYGATYPGAVSPSGMVSVVPFNVTNNEENKLHMERGWLSNPYVYQNNYMTGFSHVNLSGVGCPDLGSIILMPTTGDVNVDHKQYGSTYTEQKASPGYYGTKLNKYNVKAEATATTRTGLSRYSFPAGKSNILLNLGLGLTNETGAMAKIVSDTEIEGYKILGTFCYNPNAVFPVYFVVKFSKPAKQKGYWKKHKKLKGPRHNWSSTSGKYKLYPSYTKEMAGDDIGVYFSFDTEEEEVIEVKVGVSYVSIENARLNLETEQTGFDFDKLKNETESEWNKLLSRVLVEGGSDNDKTKFYTALYHVLLHPNILNDVNGQYPAMQTGEITSVENRNRYTVFSLWDTYRNVHPFLSLVYPEKQLDMVNSMLNMYKESGWLPKWELFSQETYVMEGDPAIPVIVDTYFRGIRKFDTKLAYEAMRKSATTGSKNNPIRPDIDDYINLGYVPLIKEFDNSVSHALEYYLADWNLALFAKELGEKEDYKLFTERSLGYRNYFDKEYGMIRPKLSDGKFLSPFNPKQGENFAPCPGFHEGTAWQYTFYVPHDIPGLKKLMGGSSSFTKKLNKVFEEDLFDMANEPDITYPYLYNYVKGSEWRSQQQVRKLIDKYFHNKPGGIPGNDDTGTLSAWLIYGMMGIYPVCPGDMNYAITSPVFDKVTIALNPDYYGKDQLIIETENNSKENVYIKKIQLNGKTYKKYFISHSDLIDSGNMKIMLDSNH